MTNGHSSLRAFGTCRLDTQKKLLWADDRPIDLPLKAIELLCLLVEGRGSLLTKDQIWHDVWKDAFVEETNLTHNIYLLRKALKDLGHGGLIETVPRRGYRFSGEVYELPEDEIVLQRHSPAARTRDLAFLLPQLALSTPGALQTAPAARDASNHRSQPAVRKIGGNTCTLPPAVFISDQLLLDVHSRRCLLRGRTIGWGQEEHLRAFQRAPSFVLHNAADRHGGLERKVQLRRQFYFAMGRFAPERHHAY